MSVLEKWLLCFFIWNTAWVATTESAALEAIAFVFAIASWLAFTFVKNENKEEP